jgi:hypothetical protein
VDPEQHGEAPYAGFLGCQDTYYIGTLKDVGRVDAQTFVDTHCSWAAAKLYVSKLPMMAVDLLHERVLTDNGQECCGRSLAHPYELSLAVQEVVRRAGRRGKPFRMECPR